MQLKQRQLPISTYRVDLPAFLGDDKNPTPFEVKFVPSGPINVKYMSAIEPFLLKSKVAVQEIEAITDLTAKATTDSEKAREMAEDRIGILYDACVVEWSTGIMDAETGKPIPNDRDTFIELANVRGVPEIASAIVELEKAVSAAGRAVDKADEDTVKN